MNFHVGYPQINSMLPILPSIRLTFSYTSLLPRRFRFDFPFSCGTVSTIFYGENNMAFGIDDMFEYMPFWSCAMHVVSFRAESLSFDIASVPVPVPVIFEFVNKCDGITTLSLHTKLYVPCPTLDFILPTLLSCLSHTFVCEWRLLVGLYLEELKCHFGAVHTK